MRFLLSQPGPAFSVADVHAGWREALIGLGQQVIDYNLDERLTFYDHALLPTEVDGRFRKALDPDAVVQLAINGLYAALFKCRPDVLMVISGFFLPTELYDLARANGIRVVLVHTECPYEDDRQLAAAGHVDLNLVNDPVGIEAFAALAPTRYVPHAYRPTVHQPGPATPELVCDLGFVGTGYPSRIQFFEAMDLAGLDVLLTGNWQALREDSPLRGFVGHDPAECLDNSEAVGLYRSARVGINTYRREGITAVGLAMGPREVEMAACGLFFLRDPRPEGDGVLDMLPTFTSPAEASHLLRWYLDRPDERAALSTKAREAIADRTFHNHAAALLRLLDQ